MVRVNIIVDPALVMIPPENASKAEVETWLAHLKIWLEEALTAPFLWLHYSWATQLLEANGDYPNFEQVRKLQRKHHLDINSTQLVKLINEFFRDETHDLENLLNKLLVIEAEESSICIEPATFIARLPEYIHADLSQLFATCSVCKHIPYPLGQGLHVATSTFDDISKELTVSVVVLEAEPTFLRPPDNKIEQKFPFLITPDDLQPLINVMELWTQGEQGIMYAISQQYRKDWVGSVATPLPFQVGLHFIESVESRGLADNAILLSHIIKAAASVIAGTAKGVSRYELHHLREKKAADSPQRTREGDQAKAWRLMLQKHGAGWRLHYWQIPTPTGSIIEFANVGKESEREIF